MEKEIHLSIFDMINLIQLIGIPILLWVVVLLKKFYRKTLLYGLKHEALIFALQKIFNNGFTQHYTERLERLKEDINWIEKK